MKEAGKKKGRPVGWRKAAQIVVGPPEPAFPPMEETAPTHSEFNNVQACYELTGKSQGLCGNLCAVFVERVAQGAQLNDSELGMFSQLKEMNGHLDVLSIRLHMLKSVI
jgi:hypothetical protein